MSTVNKIVYRLRLKLKDMDESTCSKYEVQDALDETLTEMRNLVTQFYSHISFMEQKQDDLPLEEGETVIDADGEVEFEEMGFPEEFNGIIIEYALILLSPGDYATKEQAKQLWQQKVLSLASTFSNENILLDGCYGPESSGHRRKKRGHDFSVRE
ncbi:MAG: hypothetical protein H6Q67_1852 [Firmicutes bacterium]|nr:hypothetical protein [Bacillota bacterium]